MAFDATWRDRSDKTVSKGGAQTRYNGLNDALSEQLRTDRPEFGKRLVFSAAASKGGAPGQQSASTFLIGSFECAHSSQRSGSRDEARTWRSGKIYTEIFVANGVSDSECRFDVVVWSQRCVTCKAKVSSDIDDETYCARVYSKLELLLGLRDAIDRSASMDEKTTPPHVKSMCCACKAGKCLAGTSASSGWRGPGRRRR